MIKCKLCGHEIDIHLKDPLGLRCHKVYFDSTLNDSIQCECCIEAEPGVTI